MDAESLHFGAVVSHGMWSDGEAGAVEVGDETLFVRHLREWRRRIGLGKVFEQRARAADGFFDLPESVAAVEFGRQFRVSSFEFQRIQFQVSGFKFRVFGEFFGTLFARNLSSIVLYSALGTCDSGLLTRNLKLETGN